MNIKERYKLPDFESFKKMVDGIWEREYYTNHGPLCIELEENLKSFLGVKHVVCMTNRSIALMISILAIKSKGKAVIPALSHINVAQSLKWAGMEYAFCDIRSDHPTIDINQLEKVAKDDVSLVIALNAFGHASDIEGLETFARDNQLKLVFLSDSVFGQSYKRKTFGHFGDLEIFSFDQSQMINAGEGACVATNDDSIAAKLRNIRSSYGSGKKVPIPYTGNGRMSEVQAGMALLSMDDFRKKADENKARFDMFSKISRNYGIDCLQPCDKCSDRTYVNTLLVGYNEPINKIAEELRERNIIFENFEFYGRDILNNNKKSNLPNFNKFTDQAISIPNNQQIEDSQLIGL